MNCDTIQNRILALAVAAEPTADVREHLNGCPACQIVLAKAKRLERKTHRMTNSLRANGDRRYQ